MPAPTATSAPTPVVQGAPTSARAPAPATRDAGFGRQLETARRQSAPAEPAPAQDAPQRAATADTANAAPTAGKVALPPANTPNAGASGTGDLPPPAGQTATAALPPLPPQASPADACTLRLSETAAGIVSSSTLQADDVHLTHDDDDGAGSKAEAGPAVAPPSIPLLSLAGIAPQLAGATLQPAGPAAAPLATITTSQPAGPSVSPLLAGTVPQLAESSAMSPGAVTLASPATVAASAANAAPGTVPDAASIGAGALVGTVHGLPGAPSAASTVTIPATQPAAPSPLQVAAIVAPPAAAMAQVLSAGLPARQAHDDVDASTLVAAMSAGSATVPAAAPALPPVTLAAAAGTPAFGAELGQQIAWFANRDVQHARIRLHPDELGMVDLKISVHHGAVDVAFAVQQPGAVQALQQSLPQLGQMLAQQGLALGHSEVSQQGRDGAPEQQHGHGGAGGGEVEEVPAIGALTRLRATNLLDAFA